jgi:hypothetical protein
LHISFGDDDAEEDGGTAEGPREEEAPPQRQRKEEPRRQTAPAQDTRPAQQTAPAQAVALPEVQLNRNMTMGFGRGAVVPLKDLSDDDLSYYIAMVSKNLANPAQKTHANTNAVRLAHLLAEQALGAARHGSRVVFDPNTGEVLADDQLPKGY